MSDIGGRSAAGSHTVASNFQARILNPTESVMSETEAPTRSSPIDIGRDEAIAMYYRMRLIRRFEENVVDLVNSNEIAGVTHEYVGQEAVAVGVCSALNADDVITSTHRGHGHIIAKGGKVRFMLAELMGRITGYNKGRGGSMHIADFSLGIFGANGIVAAGAPIACGAAFAFQRQGQGRLAASFFGDGAINQGVLAESLNLAAIWKLPVVFICENNGYAVTTPIGDVITDELWHRAAAFGVLSVAVDGMDVFAVRRAMAEAVARARSGQGPSFLECRTYRYVGHQTAERVMKLSYRTNAEIEEWRQRDAIEACARRLIETGAWAAEDRAVADAAVEAEIEEGIAFARTSSWPDEADALKYMYASPYPDLPAKGWEA